MELDVDYNLKNFENDINKEIGAKIKSLRILKNLTQKQLADNLNVSFQQVQKYEKGTNKISIAKLITLCKVFMVDVDSFIGDFSSAEYSLMQDTQSNYSNDNKLDVSYKAVIKKKIDSLSKKDLNKIDVILDIL